MKPWAWLAIIVAVVAAFGSTYAFGKSAGYNQRSTELQNEILDAVAEAERKKDEDWQKLLDAAEGQIIVEEKIVKEIQYVEKEIPTVIEKIVTVRPECRDLGPDYARVLSDQVRAANGLQGSTVAPGMVD